VNATPDADDAPGGFKNALQSLKDWSIKFIGNKHSHYGCPTAGFKLKSLNPAFFCPNAPF
jgi:hypothetical protein